MSTPGPLPHWDQLAATHPDLVATMRRYLDQVGCVLRPGSVVGADLTLRAFATYLSVADPHVRDVGQVTRTHIEGYKLWLAARPGQHQPGLAVNTLVHYLGGLRMFFTRITEWGWDQAPARMPMFLGDLPRTERPLPKALDDAAAGQLLRAAHEQKRLQPAPRRPRGPATPPARAAARAGREDQAPTPARSPARSGRPCGPQDPVG